MNTFQKFSVAPMLNYTDRHCRYLYRIFTKYSILYTEMIIENKMLSIKPNNIKKIDTSEHPIAIQFAGINPNKLAHCAYLAYLSNYDEINFNIGCPSHKFKKLGLGIYLLNNIPLIIQIIQKMSNIVPIPISIKTRIGLDSKDSYSFLYNFISQIEKYTNCKKIIVHARKALSSKISTKKNRELPNLKYNTVYQLKKDFPNFIIIINGGINSISEAKYHLKYVDGIMMGRTIYKNPSILNYVDSKIFNIKTNVSSITDNFKFIYHYIEKELNSGTLLYQITRHMLGLFNGIPGSKMWKHYLSKYSYKKNAGIEIVQKALQFIH